MNAILVSKKDAAGLLGLSIRTVESLIAQKELPSRRIGRRRMILRVALEKFALRDHRTCPNAAERARKEMASGPEAAS